MSNESVVSGEPMSFPFFLVPLAQLIFNAFSICVALLMLRLVHSTQLHPNCKYLLKMWSMGYFSLFFAHFVLSAINVLSEDLGTRKIGPPLRSYFLDISVSAQFICALLEICIESERLLSAFRPAQYYKSGKSRRALYPITIIILLIAAQFGYITEFSSDHSMDATAIFLIDLGTLTMNQFTVRYCKRRFEQLHGKATLNARYQVREAQELASSMQRSYVVCFFFKNLFNAFVLAGCAYTDENHYCKGLILTMPYHWIEAGYTGGLSCTSCYLLCWLMTNHPRLRRKLFVIISWSTKIEQGSIADIQKSYQSKTETDFYFDSLKKSWE